MPRRFSPPPPSSSYGSALGRMRPNYNSGGGAWQPNYMANVAQPPMPGMSNQMNPLAVFALSLAGSLQNIAEAKWKQSMVEDSYQKKLEMERKFELEKAMADGSKPKTSEQMFAEWLGSNPEGMEAWAKNKAYGEPKEPSTAQRAQSLMAVYPDRGAGMSPYDINAARGDIDFMSLPEHMKASVLPTNDAERQQVEEFNTVQRGGAIADAARTASIPWYKKQTVGKIGDVTTADIDTKAMNNEFQKLEGALPQDQNAPFPSRVGWTGRARQAMAENAVENAPLPPAISGAIDDYSLRRGLWEKGKNEERAFLSGQNEQEFLAGQNRDKAISEAVRLGMYPDQQTAAEAYDKGQIDQNFAKPATSQTTKDAKPLWNDKDMTREYLKAIAASGVGKVKQDYAGFKTPEFTATATPEEKAAARRRFAESVKEVVKKQGGPIERQKVTVEMLLRRFDADNLVEKSNLPTQKRSLADIIGGAIIPGYNTPPPGSVR